MAGKKYRDKEERYQDLKDKIETYNPWKDVQLRINIEPEPYARPRKSIKLEQMGKKNPFYNPRSNYKRKLTNQIKKIINDNYPKFDICEGEVHLTAKFYLTPPKKFTESETKWRLVEDRVINPITRPDVDNWVKPVMDVLNKLAYSDDGQITQLHAYKYYSLEDHPYFTIDFHYRQTEIRLTKLGI